jgi:hypothetical protein
MIACPHCGFLNIEERTSCKSCGKDLHAQATPISSAPLEINARTVILDEEIARQVGAGWRLQVRTETTAQLVRETSDVNGCIVILLFFLAIVPGILYMMLAKKTESMFIQIDPYGRILRTIG